MITKFSRQHLLPPLISLLLLGCQSLPLKPTATFLSGKEVGPATFSPDGNEIVFSAGNKRTSTIYKTRVDGTGLVALTTGETYDHGPVYAPDGTKLLFSSMSDGKQGDLCLMKPDGSEKIFLTTGPAHDFSPVFSPDGKKVFFIRAEWFGNYSPIALPAWHAMDVYSINIDGSNLQRITSNKYYRIGNLSIHPNENILMAIISEYQSPYSIWIIPLDDPTARRPVQPDITAYTSKFGIKNNDFSNPEFSPDGNSLLFTWGGDRKQLYTMDMKTNKTQRVTNIEKSIFHPHFSKDGFFIVFKTVDYISDGFFTYRDEPTLWIINKDGTDLKTVFATRGD